MSGDDRETKRETETERDREREREKEREIVYLNHFLYKEH